MEGRIGLGSSSKDQKTSKTTDAPADITAAEPPRGAGGRRVGEPLAAQPQQPDAPYAVDDGAGERAAALPRDERCARRLFVQLFHAMIADGRDGSVAIKYARGHREKDVVAQRVKRDYERALDG